MKMIGGTFPPEKTGPDDNGYFSRICSPDGDVRFMMSGRCGIYYCLQEISLTDTRKVAYVPIYTCETVLAPFVKAGYSLRFYEIDKDLHSVFDPGLLDEISLISLCGYYGFCNYDADFVRECKKRGIVIFEDVTHSLLSEDGYDPLIDYAAGSFRKWMGVPCGGFAIKKHGRFVCETLPPHPEHLSLRIRTINEPGNDLFWEGEMLLRRVFDAYASDQPSEYTLRHADLNEISRVRRENYLAILNGLRKNLHGISVIFPELTENAVPSHFVIYAEQRDALQAYLLEKKIRSTVYWPVGPEINLDGHDTARYIYEHILAIPCDQRFGPADMERISDALNLFGEAYDQRG